VAMWPTCVLVFKSLTWGTPKGHIAGMRSPFKMRRNTQKPWHWGISNKELGLCFFIYAQP